VLEPDDGDGSRYRIADGVDRKGSKQAVVQTCFKELRADGGAGAVRASDRGEGSG